MDDSFAKRLEEALRLRDVKQSELVEKTQISKSAISQYLSGAFEPKQKNIYKIARALNVNPVWLMGKGVDMEPQLGLGLLIMDAMNEDSANYYLDDEARQMAQEIFENPELRILFNASRKLRKEDIEAVIEITKRLKGTE